MSQDRATIVDVEANGVGPLVVVSPDTTVNQGEQAVAPPEIGFTVTQATVLDTGLSYIVRAQMTKQGAPATHVVPVEVALAVDASTTAIDGVNYSLATTGGVILVGDTDIEFVVGVLDSSAATVDLVLTLSADEQTPQQGFAVQALTAIEPTFTLTINNDTGVGDTELNFSRGDVAVTSLDFRALTLRVTADRPAPVGGITINLAVPAGQQAEFAARVQAPTQVVIPHEATSADVQVRGLANSGYSSSSPTVPDAFLLSMTTPTSGVAVGTTEPTLRVDVSDYPQGTRRLSWQTLTSETSEGGRQVQLVVSHQSEFSEALRAEFSVQVSGSASSATDYTLAPAPNEAVTIEGQALSTTYTLTPTADANVENEEELAILTLVASQPNYADGQVTLIEPPARPHVTTILADDVPASFSVSFESPGYTYTSATYTDSYDVAVTLSEPTTVPVNVAVEWVHPRIDPALAGALPTLITIPAGELRAAVSVTPLGGGSNVGGTNGESRYLLGVITNVSLGTVGVADSFVVTVVGDLADGVPSPPARNQTTKGFIYADRIVFDGVTYQPPSGGDWGDNGEQPFDNATLRAAYYAAWRTANQQAEVKFADQGSQVVTQLMEDVPGLVLRIGSRYDANGSVIAPGLEWYEDTVPQPVRDLVFFSAEAGASRRQLRALEIHAREESMPYFDNVQCQKLTFTTPPGVSPTETDNAVRATAEVRISPQDHGALWLDQCAFRDSEISATDNTTLGTSAARRIVHIDVEVRCMLNITGIAGTEVTNVGRGDYFLRWTNNSVGQFVFSDVVAVNRMKRLCTWVPDQWSAANSVMSRGLVAIVDCETPNVSEGLGHFALNAGVYGHVYLLGLTVTAVNFTPAVLLNFSRASVPSLALRAFQDGFTQAGAWYKTLFATLGDSSTNAFEVNVTTLQGLFLLTASGVRDLNVLDYDAVASPGVGTFNRAVWDFNAGMYFNSVNQAQAGWTWDGQRATSAPTTIPTRSGGVSLVNNGDLLNYSGVADSNVKYIHRYINSVNGFESAVNFVIGNVTSYDGTTP